MALISIITLLIVILLSVVVKCHSADFPSGHCYPFMWHSAEWHCFQCDIQLCAILQIDILLSVILVNVIVSNVVAAGCFINFDS
jgi:hypothetical protein